MYICPLIDTVGLGDKIRFYHNATKFYHFLSTGSVLPLQFLRTGFMVCQFGLDYPTYALSNGTYSILSTFQTNWINILLPSGIKKLISSKSYGFLGRNAGIYSNKQYLGKASVNKSFSTKIIVRSCAKNPIDHPNGGRTRGKKLIKTPWGKPARSNK